MESVFHRGCFAVALTAVGIILFSDTAQASGEFEAEIARLRDRGSFDGAIVLLARAADDPQFPAEMKAALPYEEAKTLILWASQLTDRHDAARRLNQAQAKLKRFLEQHADHPLANSARLQQGALHALRGRWLRKSVQVTDAQDPSVEPTRTTARDEFRAAVTAFEEVVEAAEKQLAALPQGKLEGPDQARETERVRARINFVEGHLGAAAALDELASDEPERSEWRRMASLRAARHYELAGPRQHDPTARLWARLKQGHALSAAGERGPALELFHQLMVDPSSDQALKPLKLAALLGAMRLWVETDEPDTETAIRVARQWYDGAVPAERDSDDGAEVRLLWAAACVYEAERGQPPPTPEERAYLLRTATGQIEGVSRANKTFQTQADELLDSLKKRGLALTPGVAGPEPLRK